MRLFVLLWLAACARPQAAGPDTGDTALRGAPARPGLLGRTDCTDVDQDDWCAADDCDDRRADVHPTAPEITADGVDQDCDGRERCWVDADRDGAPGPVALDILSVDCSAEGFTLDGPADCNDAEATSRPGGTEVPGNLSDEDCDGLFDCFVDGDRDGFGAAIGQTDRTCAEPGLSSLGGDCDDTRPLVSPANGVDLPANGVDDDCDGLFACWQDADGDGQGGTAQAFGLSATCEGPGESSRFGDCNDGDATAYQGAPELPADGVDNDCDGADACLSDVDGDGWAPNGLPLPTGDGDCDDPGEGGAGTQVGDCDDADPQVNPGAQEVPSDGRDNTCDSVELCWQDLDRDNFRGAVPVPGPLDCAGIGFASPAAQVGDCDDGAPAINPMAFDLPADGIDSNCDGTEQCYFDRDGDGYRTDQTGPGSGACDQPGEVLGALPAGDCNDSSADARPGGIEIADDGIDGNCDGSELCAFDADGDGFRGTATIPAALECDGPGLGAPNGGDCNDGDPNVNPSRPELPADGSDSDCSGAELCFTDRDGDGFRADTLVEGPISCSGDGLADLSYTPGDCDDDVRTINPAAVELSADGIDGNCDGVELCFVDADGDGHRTEALAPGSAGCDGPGEALDDLPADDCDDLDPLAYPGLPDVPGDGIDSDCDGLELCFVDQDGDGYHLGTTVPGTAGCEGPGLARPGAIEGDCDDNAALNNPGAEEIPGDGVDGDCDGGELCFFDLDLDGYRTEIPGPGSIGCAAEGAALSTLPSGDCDDTAPEINPEIIEVPGDFRDNDCDGQELCYADVDGDGYRTGELVPGPLDCIGEGIANVSSPTSDCDDDDANVNPAGVELPADGRDGDCDGVEQCYIDADSDGYRTESLSTGPLDCDAAGFALASTPTGDCEDADPGVNPGATELPADRIDTDCDGGDLCYTDSDGDGFRADVARPGTLGCTGPGEVLASFQAGDCDDDEASVNPNGVDLPADGVDSDCNGVDTCFLDADDDGFRTEIPIEGNGDCSGPGQATALEPTGDCDDSAGDVYPGALEGPGDGLDADCDGLELCLLDLDGDGYHGGSVQAGSLACDGPGQVTDATPGEDCDDGDPARSPGAEEVIADGFDADCDFAELCYKDEDGDGFRNDRARPGSLSCTAADEVTFDTPAGDCDDDDGAIYPGAEEPPGDGIDADCDGGEVCFRDADLDGYHGTETAAGPIDCGVDGLAEIGGPGGDCDEGRPEVHPDATELPGDGLDSDCDRGDLCFVDADRDGFRTDQTAAGSPSCSQPGQALASRPAGDCADGDAEIRPGVPDPAADGVDSDCDGVELCFEDADRDGFRTEVEVTGRPGCAGPGEALASVPTGDCDDRRADRSPVAEERVADGVDSDCDEREQCYIDDDRDGFHAGAVGPGPLDCVGRELAAPEDGGDCDDNDATVGPGAEEVVADGRDSDCDGGELCWRDADGDGYRTYETTAGPLSCVGEGIAPSATPAGDCDDAAAGVRPGATELVADGVDSDCDSLEQCWVDSDGDGYHSGATLRGDLACAGAGLAGAEASPGDCADRDAERFPGNPDLPADGIDSDCDGVELCYVDADRDGFRTEATAPGSAGCGAAGEAVAATPDGDCDDGAAGVFPGARDDVGDGVDSDCDGADRCYVDADGDGWRTDVVVTGSVGCAAVGEALAAAPAGDCDDDEAAAYPSGAEVVADGIDGDCNGRELCWVDRDGDGWRIGETTVVSNDLDCADGGEADAAAATGDCDDNDDAVHPDATELPGDRADSDCDGGDMCYVDADGDGVRTEALVAGSVTCDGDGEAVATLPGPDCDDADALAPTPNGCDGEPPAGDKDPVDEEEPVGCACDARGGGSGLALGLALLALRRRRASTGG